MPFDVTDLDGVSTLTLDTPRSAVNIFNRETADQLVDLLAAVTPATTRAIVFQTAKTNSFINGVGLLLAHATQTHEDVVRASTPAWTAYRAVREAPVPTIAVVQGNCFGCGVEFALNCDYRIATDTCQTQFYMTELNDYLFLPLFGGTWNLPEAVGLDAAIDLLLWGERWSAIRARAQGLIDEAIAHQDLADGTRAFVARVLAGAHPSRRRGRVTWGNDEERAVARARQRIAALPPQYHEVYSDALALLEAGARQDGTFVEHQQRELGCSGASALSPIGKGAYAYFYLRQIAAERAGGSTRRGGDTATVSIGIDAGDEARVFADDVGRRMLPGFTFASNGSAEFRLVGTRCAPPRNGHAHDVAVRLSPAAAPAGNAELYAPAYRAGGRLLELAIRAAAQAGPDAEEAARLTRTLQRLGFEVARTTPNDTFVSNRLLIAYLAPLVRYLLAGGAGAVVNGELRRFGFVRRPHDLLAGCDRAGLVVQLAAALGESAGAIEAGLSALASPDCSDASEAAVIDAVCISLLDAVVAARRYREVSDTTIVDLIARELLDFPRHLCSLASWLKTARVATAVARDQARALVSAPALATARAFVAGGREFYR